MHGDPLGFERSHQRILGVEYERHLVVESLAVTGGGQVHQQALGSAVTQALGHHQHTNAGV